ncbi:MAG: argininosuccinate lyase, partial [Kiritimatiellae bacterium]|nr:argininosuccinate lyase [Kiritimatiellia bacterium]
MKGKMWDARFSKAVDSRVNDFNSSISFDWRMYKSDITGSIAHATMLGECGIIAKEESAKIIEALRQILADIESGALAIDPEAVDIHMFIEAVLTERIGETGKRLHTARSRNDQVALDIRMHLKEEIKAVQTLIASLLDAICSKAEEHVDTVMPGYTHLQRAQPVTFAHYILAYAQMFMRDYERLCDVYKRTDVMPLGSGALASTTYPIDRHMVADLLGFSTVTENSMDGVSDRDFVLELGSALSILMMHMSRFSEEIILWCSSEFKFIELDDAYSTGSSIMPQKKNPDVAEIMRGKTGRAYGNLMSLMTILKGIPLTYNRDMQEDKISFIDPDQTVRHSLSLMADMLDGITFRPERMRKALASGFLNATELADYLVGKGMPFREAHHVSGRSVALAEEKGCGLEDLSLEELRGLSE